MSAPGQLLPSWRPGAARTAVLGFLDDVLTLPVPERLACFDNDGTLWCERPSYVQLDFFLDALRRRVHDDPSVGQRPEFAAVLSGDRAAVAEMGLPRIGLALTSLFEGLAPEDFTRLVRDFMAEATNTALGRRHREATYLPMLELVAELRRREVSIALVSGGGTEFVRAVSQDLYGVPPESVVGTLIEYDYARDDRGRPSLRRSARVVGAGNEGAAKVATIQTQLGRRPCLAAGNSGGDREMLEWVAVGDGPHLSLLVDHDDPDREMAYVSRGETVADTEPIVEVGARLGWTVVSMRRDWAQVFAPPPDDGRR